MNPSAVKKAAKAAEEAHKQAYQTTVEDVTDEPERKESEGTEDTHAGDRERVSEHRGATDSGQPAAASEPEESPAEPESAEQVNWEQRYKSLKGKYDAEVPRLHQDRRNYEQQLRDLREEHLKAQQQQLEERDYTLITDEDRRDFGEDMISVAKRAAKEEFQPEIDRLRQENDYLKTQFQGVQQETAQSARDRLLSQLDQRQDIPNWREINQSQEFMDWLQYSDPFSGRKKHDLLMEAYNAGDADRTSVFFKQYLSEHAAMQSQDASPRPAKNSLDTMVAPGRTRTVTPNRAQEGNAQVWTDESIRRFYADLRAGKFRTDKQQAEAMRIERDIIAAQKEGRYRPE